MTFSYVEIDMRLVKPEEFEQYSKRMMRAPRPLRECLEETYDFLSKNKSKFFTIDEIANATGLKRTEVLESFSILREEYGIQISERASSVYREDGGQILLFEYAYAMK